MDETIRRRGPAPYYVVAAVLIAFGVLGILTIGLPFLLAGVLLLALTPYRNRPEILWPPLVGVLVWTATEAAVAPWRCGESVTGSAGPNGVTVSHGEACHTAFGMQASNGAAAPALIALAVAVVAAVATRVLLARRARRRV
jgi:hypothetical protein